MADPNRATREGTPEISRAARIAGLRGFATPTLEAIERRRLHLWILTVVLLLSLAAALALLAAGAAAMPSSLSPVAAQIGLLVLTALFCAYALEKELTLRRLARLLIEERVLTAALTNRVSELSALLEAGRVLSLDLDLRQVLSSLLASAIDLLGANDASVMLVRSDNELHTVAAAGQSRAGGARQTVGRGIAGRVAESREPLLIDGLVEPDGDRAGRPESAMCAPLIHGADVLGVLNVNAPGGRRYTEHDLRALSLFAEQAAVAVANAQLLENERLAATRGIFRALHDPLTNLPNRALFLDRLRHALARRRDPQRRLAVLFLDLERFKAVNDRHGHAAGDRVLVEVSRRLDAVCRRGDTLARLGGDEFAILLDDVADAGEVRPIAQRFLESLAAPFRVGEVELELVARLGIGLESTGWTTAEELLASADASMRSVRNGRAPSRYGEPPAAAAAADRDLRSALARALAEDQLDLYYQPIVMLHSREIVAFEALLRWHHPDLGLRDAESFIHEAEQSGLLPTIDLWTLERACRCAAGAVDVARPVEVHVNLLPSRLHHPETVDLVTGALVRAGLPAERLVLEITEDHVLLDVEGARAQLEALRALGVKIALDDFGTGYSSLSYLRSLPVTMVKMDRLFIQGLAGGGPARPLVEAIVRFGHGLALDVVAEGIEHEDQLAGLLDLGCTLGQGYLLARPQPQAELLRLLADGLAPTPSSQA